MPDGRRMLWSEINDASMAMDLGGVNRGGTRGGPSIQVVPNATPRPSRGLTGDNSNAGLVNRNLFRQDNQANTDWWTSTRDNSNRPHSAMDFDGSQSASGSGGRIVDTGASGGLNGNTLYSPTPSETFDTTGLHNFGEPNVEISGFPDQRQRWNPSSNSGGSIWSDDLTSDPSGAGMVNSSLFGDNGFTYTETPRESADLSGLNTYDETTYQPTIDPPDPFTLHTYDETQYINAPPDNDNDLSGLHNYGYQGSGNLSNFGGGMSIGPFLNTSLSDMRFGEGYPQIGFGGRPDDLQPGEGYIDPGSEGGQWVDRPDGSGSDWVENATATGRGTTYIPVGDPNLPYGPTAAPTTPPGMTIVGHDQQNGQPIYRDAQGDLFVNEGTGTRVYPTERMFGNYSYLGQQLHQPETARNSTAEGRQAANAAQMSFAAMNPTMNLKFITAQSDRGRTLFNTSGRDRPNISLEGDVIVRQPSGNTSASRSGVRGMMGG